MIPAPETSSTGACPAPPVALTRTPRGWSVQSPAGSEAAGDLVEGLSLADIVAEEFGVLTEPDRTARRSARGTATAPAEPIDPAAARVAELERTVAQLEHALAARVSTERAIGVLAERHGTDARAAFEALRRDARSQGRPVAELAREVLDGLGAATAPPATPPAPPAPGGRSLAAPGVRPPSVVVAVAPSARRPANVPPVVTAADGVS
ncbi:ANTAR domain-containing protein [Blastococcus haudaquaticus]|uniref:ANTAR domain-containing protein n=1 Tax=Blastococcus haudaquaticus TaxID=1938745 RepID=A0A286GDG0_9ACTN|nr:ANTAR domain-containing protein [Blastococcus haudaquaticus]SOD93538.1 ANTAR domain-containing protein [Blastococcus haudaquaticus]